MINYWRLLSGNLLVFVLVLLSTTNAVSADRAADGRVDDLDVEDIDENKEPTFIPLPFVVPQVSGSTLFVDWFDDRNAIGRKWIKSKAKKENVDDSIAKYDGEWEIRAPLRVVIDGDLGLFVKTRARHHAIAAKFDQTYIFNEKPLVVQYEVKYEDGQECGGGYVKLLTEGSEEKLDEFTNKTPYTIMFGPDKCGPTGKVHFIVRFKNPKSSLITEHHAKQPSNSVSSYFDDHKTHLYTLVVRPDETFTVMVDQQKIMSGSMRTSLEPSITPPTVIDDPDDKKPEDWDEREKIDDPDAKKPDDWDEDAPKKIKDENAKKPDDWLENEELLVPDSAAEKPTDWDENMDGVWEPPKVDNPKCKGISGCGAWVVPLIDNPNYKGKWKPSLIANPAYKGKWKPRQIDNPHYYEPHPFTDLAPISALGIELWTMSENIGFDNFYIGDDEKAANSFAKQTFVVKIAQEASFESASSPNQGVLSKLVSATNERPWLWAIYVLSVLIPVVILIVVCFGRKSSAGLPDYKKSDEPQPDDEVPELVGDDDDDESQDRSSMEPEVVEEKTNNGDKIAEKSSPILAKREVGEDAVTQLSGDEEIKENGGSENAAERSSPRARRMRQRKQD